MLLKLETFNKYFADIFLKLGSKRVVSSRNNDLETGNLFAITKKHKSHSSITAIEKYVKGRGEKAFNFRKATNDIVLRNIKKLNNKKASQFYNDPTKYIKKICDISTPVVTDDYNNLTIGVFLECFKTSEVIPTH